MKKALVLGEPEEKGALGPHNVGRRREPQEVSRRDLAEFTPRRSLLSTHAPDLILFDHALKTGLFLNIQPSL